MSQWIQFLEEKMQSVDEGTKKWIQGAINPAHRGFCTPLSNPKCTPRRKALAMRFKKGDLHHGKKKKDQ